MWVLSFLARAERLPGQPRVGKLEEDIEGVPHDELFVYEMPFGAAGAWFCQCSIRE